MQIAKVTGLIADVKYDFRKGMGMGCYLFPEGHDVDEPSFADIPIEGGVLKYLDERIKDQKRKVIITVETVDDDNIANN